MVVKEKEKEKLKKIEEPNVDKYKSLKCCKIQLSQKEVFKINNIYYLFYLKNN